MSGFAFNQDKNNLSPKELLDGVETAANANYSSSTVRGSSYAMNSMFDTDTSAVSSKIIETASEILKNKSIAGSALNVSILGSEIFKGVNITMTDGSKTRYSQAIIIDERRLKSVTQLQDEAKQNGKVIFGSALLNANNAKYLASFKPHEADAVVMEPIIVVAEVMTDAAITDLVRNIFKRMEARPFTSVEETLRSDRSKDMIGFMTSDGQNLNLQIVHKENSSTLEDLIIGTASSVLNVQARIEPMVGMKQVIANNVATNQHAVRPVIFIKSYDKPKTFAKFNLEYGLMAIIAATVLTRPDKVIAGLLPSQKQNTNIGALNKLFKVVKDAKGEAAPLNLLDNKVDLGMKVKFIHDLTTPAGLGVDIEYRSDASAYSALGAIVETSGTTEVRERSKKALLSAYKNITGFEYSGNLVERTFQYPTGLIIDKNGNQKDISTIDAIWLATAGEYDLATRWILSDMATDSLGSKVLILSELVNKYTDMDIKIKGAGSKIILANDFIQALVVNGRVSIESTQELELPNQQTTFGNMGNLEVTHGFDSVGFNPIGPKGGISIMI